MTFLPTNATGWNELYNGSIVAAPYTMYNIAFGGWVIPILFILYQFMLYMKTRSLSICFVTGIIAAGTFFFVSIVAGSSISGFMNMRSMQFIFIILLFELGGILYSIFWK